MFSNEFGEFGDVKDLQETFASEVGKIHSGFGKPCHISNFKGEWELLAIVGCGKRGSDTAGKKLVIESEVRLEMHISLHWRTGFMKIEEITGRILVSILW